MTPETLLAILPTATIVASSLGLVALRQGSARYVLLSLAALVLIALLFVAPRWQEAGDLFILWRLMIMAVLGAASLVVMGVCFLIGAAIASAVLGLEWLITRRATPVPVWIIAALCVILCISAGQILEF